MWKKLKGSGKVPHLSRWFDNIAELPECKAAVEELDLNAKRRAGGVGASTSAAGGSTADGNSKKAAGLLACAISLMNNHAVFSC